MSRLYSDVHRSLQTSFETRALADRLEDMIVKSEFHEAAKAFVESRDFLFLTTVDHLGRPTVSYKGGAPGFIRLINASTLVFPSYDGNGMYLSMGNLSRHPEIGILFIDFEKPFRLRVQGRAEMILQGPEVEAFKDAEMAVKVRVTETWMNCPRYIHRHKKLETSRYAPGVEPVTPFCEWKRIDGMQDVIRPAEKEKAAQLGTINIEEWMGKVVAGDADA